ncbi:rod shape-determining protein RodA [Streptobacillus moniliformis]|uniref:Rod shape-determining protein RodA n=1 Tax=Streptobacillus moniliformis (strain ATCC 14647 / DSM 12112 / NCTC 10651 / 9901) TaxID=519441 RepID=D1AYM0_STRM9|nr:rod shape-determining protein RodA [Streptobacillus moniliformis]ACZ01396.1 rod shape-determining protein RodA [Streptobacillus moniliformis DSM 12112]AVL43591.1 rod shape-determining protein RodA [Streptobacillus moniliformis]QXW66082.1 rod shape-determining protein RodA [Streptobacillus moniliformis]SQA13444.1 Rod shape-determining protein RodA [Streptobacillus moniliformis]
MFSKRSYAKLRNRVHRLDKSLLLVVYLLVFVSTAFVYSATRSMYYVKSNLLWTFVGTLILIVAIFIDYRFTKKIIKPIYVFSGLLLLYTRFFGVVKLGARRWINIGITQIQPSEFVKIFLIMIYSFWFVKKFPNGINSFKHIILAFIPGIPILGLLLLQPDLGTTLILCFSFLCMLYLSNANVKPIVIIFLILGIMSVPTYMFVLKDYQKTRIEVFLNPEKDLKNKGWHVAQSKISIGSGGLSGKGYLEGSQSRLKFLPEPQTDFIFSVIGEEIGFLGSTFVLSLYFLLIYIIINISKKIIDDYGRIILYGISGIFLAHVIINVGMTLGIVPVTGKPLLLMSYGGSSFISSFLMISLIQNIKIYNGDDDDK